MRLNGKYADKGLALDEVARSESMASCLRAIGTFNQRVKQLVPAGGLQVRVADVWLEGSFIKYGGRAGIYRNTSFDVVDEMQIAKAWAKNGLNADHYVGRHWSGCSREAYEYPSDVDVFVEYTSSNRISIADTQAVDDKVKEIAKDVFEKTGVFISAHSLKFVDAKRVRIEDVLSGKFQLKARPFESQV